MPHTFTSLWCHVIFSTKDRQPLIDVEVRPRLFAYMAGIVREAGATALAVNGVDDHVHLLIGLPAKLSVADAMRVLKTNASRWVHEQWPHRRSFAWQAGYGAFGVSRSNVDEVVRYVEQQEDHHRRMTFQDEYLAFLRRHGIAFDERYVWE